MSRTFSILILFVGLYVFVSTAPLNGEDATPHTGAPTKTGKQRNGCPPGVWVCRRSRVVLLTRVTRDTHPLQDTRSPVEETYKIEHHSWFVKLIKSLAPRKAKIGIPKRGMWVLNIEKRKRIKRGNKDCPVGIWGCKPTASTQKQ